MASELANILLRASGDVGPVHDNDPLRNAVAPLASYVQSQRDKGLWGRLAEAAGPRMGPDGNPIPPGVGDFVNAAMWVLPGAKGGTIRPGSFNFSGTPANRNSVRAERAPIIPAAERNPQIGIAESNPYAVTMSDLQGARGNLDKLNNLRFSIEQWETQSGRSATASMRRAVDNEIEKVMMDAPDIGHF